MLARVSAHLSFRSSDLWEDAHERSDELKETDYKLALPLGASSSCPASASNSQPMMKDFRRGDSDGREEKVRETG